MGRDPGRLTDSPASAAAPDPPGEKRFEVAVAGREDVARGVITLTLQKPDGSPLPHWQPGAHIDVILDNGVVRQYSLCGDPSEETRWRIAVLREESGRGGSQHIHDTVHVGSRVMVRGPRNHFEFTPSGRYIFIAGGIGITPLLPMMAAAARRGDQFTMMYGGRTRSSMAFVSEVGAYGDCVTLRPQDEFGLLDLDTILGEAAAGTLVYCCGPEPLLAAVEDKCAGWPLDALRVERFAPRRPAGPAVNGSFTVVASKSGQTYQIPADESILSVLEDAGEEVYYSCTEGTCGTCETQVLEGEIDHRDSVLSAAEQSAGDKMMICVSRCKGTRLVLDI
jgi:ferredoxin-NADP reductase